MWIFFIFRFSKIHVSLTSVVSSLSLLRYCLSSSRCRHATVSCCAYFRWSQNELAISTSSSNNASSQYLISRAKIEALNLHHRRWSSFPDHPTPTLHRYKNVISTLITFHTTQPHLYFASSLTKVPRHRSSTHRRHSLSPPSQVHRPSIQQHS
jgi:hypothetical protein